MALGPLANISLSAECFNFPAPRNSVSRRALARFLLLPTGLTKMKRLL